MLLIQKKKEKEKKLSKRTKLKQSTINKIVLKFIQLRNKIYIDIRYHLQNAVLRGENVQGTKQI